MSRLKIPFIANIPIEKEKEFEDKVNIELAYEKERDRRITKAFNNPKSKLRKVGDYLWQHLNEEIAIDKIAEDLGLPKSTITASICDLNFYRGFPLTMIPVSKKAGYIQSVLKSDEDYEKWDRKKMRTITSMSAVRDKAERIVSSKTRMRKKKKEIVIEKEVA